MNRFLTLLKREFWEHRGGFLWAPAVTAAFILTITVVGVLIAHGWFGEIRGRTNIGVEIGTFMKAVPDEALDEVAHGFSVGLLGLGSVIQMVLTVVLFFYCLGSLYDDRKDRSVLFWKSLPVSDLQTVLSKVVTAALVAPLIAFAATVALHIAFLGLVSLVTLIHGGSPMRLVFGPAEPLAVWALLLAKLPINALWLLPTFGWLMLVSSFARSKVFLWAIAPPVLLGIGWNILEVSRAFQLPTSWIWTHVVARALPVFVIDDDGPTDGSITAIGMRFGEDGPTLAWSDLGAVLTNVETWIGAALGLAMLAGAVYFRRRRELAD